VLLSGPLEEALANSVASVGPDQPVVPAVGRGRLTFRMPMSRPDGVALAIWLPVFEQALKAAARLGARRSAADRATCSLRILAEFSIHTRDAK
jgi:hypothetical protein